MWRGSFFEGTHLQLWKILCLTYFSSINFGRSRDLSQLQIMKELEISSKKDVVNWKQFCCDVCVSFCRNHSQQIGGVDRVVEIDETLFARRNIIVAELFLNNGFLEDMTQST